VRSKLTVATSFPIHPPLGGGQVRVLGLYSQLPGLGIDVDVVALTDYGTRSATRTLAPGLREIRVPKTEEHNAAEAELARRARLPATDISLALHHHLTPGYAVALEASARDAGAVVACHPFGLPALEAATDRPLIFEAQDVETDLKAGMLGDGEASAELVGVVREVERRCCERAAATLVCSSQDAARLGTLFGLASERAIVVPNGANPDAVPFADPALRAERKRRLRLEGVFQALFIGSWHEPNVVAANAIVEAARMLPDVRFLVVGSVGRALRIDRSPPNVDVCGAVEEGFLRSVLGLVDAALNPMRLGSGTNLKMLEYCLSGVPVISSTFGARGLALKSGEHYIAAEPEELAPAVATLRDEPEAAVAARIRAAQDHVRERFAWARIARDWLNAPAMRALLPVSA
jgi:glycosyltransferase involved in cell wall biosynthesis